MKAAGSWEEETHPRPRRKVALKGSRQEMRCDEKQSSDHLRAGDLACSPGPTPSLPCDLGQGTSPTPLPLGVHTIICNLSRLVWLAQTPLRKEAMEPLTGGTWEALVCLRVDMHSQGSLTSPRMADNKLLLPLPVLPQTPNMVPCKAKEDRQVLGQHDRPTRPGWVCCLSTVTKRKQNNCPPQAAQTSRPQEEMCGQCTRRPRGSGT